MGKFLLHGKNARVAGIVRKKGICAEDQSLSESGSTTRRHEPLLAVRIHRICCFFRQTVAAYRVHRGLGLTSHLA